MPHTDPDKRRAYRRRHYAAHKDWYRRRNRAYYEANKDVIQPRTAERNRKVRTELQQWFLAYKSTLACIKCGEAHPRCLDFHHKRGKKTHLVSRMINEVWSKEKILLEIAKCEVLCANCHRKEHFDELGNPIKEPKT